MDTIEADHGVDEIMPNLTDAERQLEVDTAWEQLIGKQDGANVDMPNP